MSTRFGARARGLRSRQHLIYLGSGAILLSALTLGTTIVMSDQEASAHVKVVAPESIDTMLTASSILVPNQAIAEGTKLHANMFTETRLDRNSIPEGAIRPADLQGDLYAKVNLEANKPVIRDALSASAPFGNVADLVKPGYRAATIEVDATAGVEGWASAGAHVDIVVTYLDAEDGKKKSQIAIEDAVVLSYNRNTKRGENNDSTKVDSTATVTLSLPVMDAVKLHTAKAMGRIGLILRSADDIKTVGNAEITGEDFKVASKSKQKLAKLSAGRVSFTDRQGNSRELELSDNTWTANDLQ